MYITNNPEVALIAQNNGVNRIWIDLETLGKEQRQHNMNTVKSKHSVEDIYTIAPLLTKSDMLVRINPWNQNSLEEIEQVISAGADIIMLPMWRTVHEVSDFITAVNNRAKVCLLLETREAEFVLEDVLKLGGIDEIHIGLNDLHLSYGLTFMFELVSNGTVERICNKIKKSGILYGFGGIACIGEGMLPAEKIILEHYRIGSTRAILSRSFCNTDIITDISEIERVFSDNMKSLREFENTIDTSNTEIFEKNKDDIKNCVEMITETIDLSRRIHA